MMYDNLENIWSIYTGSVTLTEITQTHLLDRCDTQIKFSEGHCILIKSYWIGVSRIVYKQI